ncbi:MAG: HAMP domain-containing histidine kinase [Paenibacillus sp.]|nr:HAMP domain-containing histidine kinase [Paenibacillus sp.]
MIRRRFAVRFAWQMAVTGLMLAVLAIIIVIWMLEKFEDIEISRNFAPMGISRLISEADIDSNGLIVNSVLLQRLKEDGGWLQSLDEKGNVLQSFNAPNDLPARYAPGQLIDYWLGNEPFPYRLGLWIQEKDKHLYTMLYGERSTKVDLLQRLISDGKIMDDQILFSNSTIVQLDQMGSWVQVLDREGVEVASWKKPGNTQASYTLHELAMRTHNPTLNGLGMDTSYDHITGLTWAVQYPMDINKNQAARFPMLNSESGVMIIGIGAFLLSAFVLFILLSLWYANRFGSPVLYILSWIQRLGKGDYSEHVRVNNERRNRKGDWKRGYRIFGEVMDSIDSLAIELRAAKDAEEQTQKNREEWIAGVTHDMKTPLSSIQGYAHMLEAEKYIWSEEEVRQFASTILEKTVYMNKLINDLTLTYRLRNGVIPVTFEELDICVLLSESVSLATSHLQYEGSQIRCITPSTPIMAAVYPPWFERVVDNIIANAIFHNSPGTGMIIELIELPEKGWRIDFRDDGQGMDPQTIARLFDRYYRGTNTDSSIEGSGLGMAITKELVQAMGGRIAVSSQIGEGTVISTIYTKSVN